MKIKIFSACEIGGCGNMFEKTANELAERVASFAGGAKNAKVEWRQNTCPVGASILTRLTAIVTYD